GRWKSVRGVAASAPGQNIDIMWFTAGREQVRRAGQGRSLSPPAQNAGVVDDKGDALGREDHRRPHAPREEGSLTRSARSTMNHKDGLDGGRSRTLGASPGSRYR